MRSSIETVNRWLTNMCVDNAFCIRTGFHVPGVRFQVAVATEQEIFLAPDAC
jgi:hypothetical protein